MITGTLTQADYNSVLFYHQSSLSLQSKFEGQRK